MKKFKVTWEETCYMERTFEAENKEDLPKIVCDHLGEEENKCITYKTNIKSIKELKSCQ